MKKILLWTVIIFMSLIILKIFILTPQGWKGRLINPIGPTPTATPVPPQAPKTFKFDRTTDLELELSKINPQILDSDFE